MDELRELYQQVILDHNKNPKNYGKPETHSHDSEGYNPLCGDRIHIYAEIENDIIKSVRFEGSGCAISKASASVMTTMLVGKSVTEAKAIFDGFQEMITADVNSSPNYDKMGKLAVFSGVREFPTRVKCASLAWHTVLAAIEKNDDVVSTE